MKSQWCLNILMCLGITLQQPDDRWVTFGAFNELVKAKFPIHVFVHLAKNLVCSFLWCGLIFGHLHHWANHFVDGGDYLKHFLPGDEPITVQVVHGEGPLEFLFEFTARCHWECAKKLAKIYRTVTVGIKCSKNMFRKFRSVSVGEKIAINFFEFFNTKLTVRAVFEEAFVPLLDLSVGELCVGT